MMDYYKSLILEDLQKGITFYGSEEELQDLQYRLISYLNEVDGLWFDSHEPNYLHVKYLINAGISNN